MEDATVLATMSDEENQESETFAFDSDKEYTRASSQTRNDEAYDEERWWSEGKCIHCKDTDLCYIYKYGPFCINIANTNRKGNGKTERGRLLLGVCNAYHNAQQYTKFTKSSPIKEQIHENDIEHLPHCTYRLMDNWLKGVKAASRVETSP